ncbi:hypothetical protein OGAPHI_005720 [Ogataea philodendri]|uniref:Zn(2)-C6 fungal-type domain-containing protein n=1 Tax=Ogataea philodendri TaxID=1378263 RepID=A0A9P8NYB3_9ASCO|nr:uncharacterized protein OGAPHI_005720 [Ogataea philodendri]KAH3662468.1 hypothetical protein OGAPHI_005720 [Ogataea philodendri]
MPRVKTKETKEAKERHTRTTKACELCHRQKTRCLKSGSSSSCFRCLALEKPCSLASEPISPSVPETHNQELEQISVGYSLASISADVREVLRVLKNPYLPEPSPYVAEDFKLNLTHKPFLTSSGSPLLYLASTRPPNASFPPTILSQLHLLPVITPQTDIISQGFLGIDEAVKLLDIFRDRYGRWISYPEELPTANLLEHFRAKCPLLLTVVCALSLRYGDPKLKELVYDQMLIVIKTDLEANLINMPRNLEFIQCLTILSIYSVSLSQESAGLRLDGWYLSHLGIDLFMQLNNFGLMDNLYDVNFGGDDFNELTAYRTYNTLVLIHMAYCLLTGKQSFYSLKTLQPRKFYDNPLSTNFDYRVIAEMEVYLFAYRYLHMDEDFETVQNDMKDWLSEWEELFTSSANEFVEIDYHFTEMLLMLWKKRFFLHDVKRDPEVLQSVNFHATQILSLAISIKDDSYFAFLSDQMHLIIVYSAKIMMGLDLHQSAQVSDLLDNLAHRYGRIATAENDMTMAYSETLSYRG